MAQIPASLDAAKVQKAIRKVRKLLKNQPRRPSPGDVHSLRTNFSRIESALNALELDSRKRREKLLRDIERVRKRAGKLRDMDVLIADSAVFHTNSDPECLVQLIEHLAIRRDKSAKNLHGAMKRYGARIRDRLKRASKEIESLGPSGGSLQDSETVRDAAANARKLSSALNRPATLRRSNLHAYRLKVKELRYVLQLLDQAGSRDFVRKLGEVKDAIGDWHDWQQLVGIAKEVVEGRSSRKFVGELQRIAQSKYERARSLAVQLKKDSLAMVPARSPRTRKFSHRRLVPRAVAAASAVLQS